LRALLEKGSCGHSRPIVGTEKGPEDNLLGVVVGITFVMNERIMLIPHLLVQFCEPREAGFLILYNTLCGVGCKGTVISSKVGGDHRE
jgi:hypothetical protein